MPGLPSNIDWNKYKIKPVITTPGASPGGLPSNIDWNKYKIPQPGQKPVVPPQTMGSKIFGAAKNASVGVAQSEIGLAQNLGQGALSITDKLGLTKGASKGTFFKDPATLQSKGLAQGAGNVVGTVAPYLIPGVGEEDLAATAPKIADYIGGLAGKVAGFVAKKAPGFAANTAIGTVQAKGNVGQGLENAGLAEVGQGAMGLVSKGLEKILPSAEKDHEALIDMLTPRVTGKAYEKAGTSGRLAEPSLGDKAGLDGSSMPQVKHAIQSVKDVASSLGKKTSDIVKTGTAQVTKNVNRVNDTIKEYAEKKVLPFLERSGVNYNFADLRKALENIKPINALRGEAKDAYNLTRERILSAVAKNVSSQTTGGNSLTELRDLADSSGTIPQKITNGDPDFWDARKIIDEVGNAETKGKIFGSEAHNGATQAWKELRGGFKDYLSDGFRYPGQMEKVNQANDFLRTSQTQNMDKTGWNVKDLENKFGLKPSIRSEADSKEWEQHMSNLEGLFNARTNLGTKLSTERGKSVMELFAKEHPMLTRVAGASAKVAGTAALTTLGLGGLYEGAKKLGI